MAFRRARVISWELFLSQLKFSRQEMVAAWTIVVLLVETERGI